VRQTTTGRVTKLTGLGGLAWLIMFVMTLTHWASAQPAYPGSRQSEASKPPRAEPPPVFARMCAGKCHSADRITDGRRSRAQWGEVLDKMVGEGAEGSDEDFTAVARYLVGEYGRVNVNADPADDLALVLHLDVKDAEAIVTYRKEHGKFEDFAALTAVPGIAADTLQKRRDAIVF